MSPLLTALFGLSRQSKRIIQLLADIVLIIISFLLAMTLRLDSIAFVLDPQAWLVLPIMVPVSIAIFIRLGFYRAIVRYLGLKATQAILAGVLASALVLGLISSVLELPIPRSVPFIYAILALFTIGGVRVGLRLLYMRGQQRHKTRVLIYGAGAAGRQLAVSLRHGRDYEPIAFVDFAPRLKGTHVQGLKVHSPRETVRLIETYGVEKFLLAIPEAGRARRQEVLKSVEPLSIPVQTMPDMTDVISGKAKVNELRDVAVEDLLGRDPISPDPSLMGACITGKVVMVTGAGGSIGSELCRQIIRQYPEQLLLVDISEYALYRIEQDLTHCVVTEALDVPFHPIIASVQNGDKFESLLRTFQVNTIYHAAAYKHVPLVEKNMAEGVQNNVFGTLRMAKAAVAAGVTNVVLVSTDKAVRPTNVMGATKRLAELVCQSLALEQKRTCFSMVRFGNVLGSSGSVVPLFRQQIEKGGPITVTHPEITRYFMTIPEAAQLVIQAGSMTCGGDVFVLDMGKPVKIAELASRMVRLTGLEPYFPDFSNTAPINQDEAQALENGNKCERKGDIPIIFTGLRSGEKLYEELLVGDAASPTSHPRIMTANESSLPWAALRTLLDELELACQQQDMRRIRKVLGSAPTGYSPNNDIVDIQWLRHSSGETNDILPDPSAAQAALKSGNMWPSAASQKCQSSSPVAGATRPDIAVHSANLIYLSPKQSAEATG